jgi:The  BURPS668_1122 family of deaminases
VNTADEWIETLLEGGSVLSAAEGLGHTFDGLELNKSGSSVGMAQLGKTLDCAGDLVKASRLIDDTSIRDKFQSAVLLSSIVGLADNYKPHTNNIETQGLFDSPFSVLASTGDLQATANQLKKWQLLSEQGANTSEVEVPLSSITLFNGRPAFFEDVKIFGTPAIYLDQPNSGFGVDPSIQDGALATFGSWRDKIRIYRANGKADTYSATSSSRSIWLFTKAIDLVSASDKQIASDKYIPLYLGDRISSVLSLQFNKPNGKFPTTWLDKLAVSKDYAIAEAPRYFSTEVIQIWNSVIQHPFLAGAGLAAMGGVHAFAPPVAVALDAAMMAFFGAESVFHLGSFFIKAIKSQDEAGLRDASNELLKFVGSAINAATSGAGVFAANKISKGATAAETLSQVGGWLQTSASLGSEFLKAFSWDNVLALRSSTDALKSFFLLPALRSMVRADVRRFMQFGEEASVSFLSSELPRLLSNPIEGLRSFGDKWNVLGQIVERLEQLPDVATALGQYPRNLAGVLNAGVDGINAIQSRVEIMGDIPVLWAKRLSLMDSPLEANRTLEGLSYVVRKRQELGLNTLKPGIVTNNVGYGNFNVTLANGGVFNTGREALIAVSGPQSPAGTVAAPLLRRLTQSSSRPTDSEAKILENIADIIIQSGAQADGQGKYSGVKGTVQLFTERKPCDECTPLIKILWKNLFPNVEITEVLHGPRYLPGDLQKDLNNTDNFTNVLK